MKIFIGMPCYDGNMKIETAFSLIQNISVLTKYGHDVVIEKVKGSPYIVTARNVLVKKFIESDCDCLVFVDCDLSFSRNAIKKLIESGKDVCVGAYPFKEDQRFFSVKPVTKEKKITAVEINGDLYIELVYGATGLMCIKRNVLERMIVEYNVLNYITRDGKLYSLFDTGHFNDIGEYSTEKPEWVGEDYNFCRRWRALGGKIWCYPNIDFEHIGNGHTSRGNYFKYITGNQHDSK